MNMMQPTATKTAGTKIFETAGLIERLTFLLMDLVRRELDSVNDEPQRLTGVQALLIFNIGDTELTAGELTSRGLYAGSNVTYNLDRLAVGGYIERKRGETDRRNVHVSLTAKGKIIAAETALILAKQAAILKEVGITEDHLDLFNTIARKIEKSWLGQVRR